MKSGCQQQARKSKEISENEKCDVNVTQFLSGMSMLNVVINIQAEAGWPTGRACNDKLSRAQMIQKLNKIKPKKVEDTKVMYKKIEALKVKYHDQAKILDNDTIVTHLFLVCAKLYKSKLMQAQVEAEVNNTNIMFESLIRCMNVAWRIKSDREGITQVGEGKVALTKMEFKGKCHTCGKYVDE